MYQNALTLRKDPSQGMNLLRERYVEDVAKEYWRHEERMMREDQSC